MRAIAARDKPCPGGALTVCPREGASKARLRLQFRAGSKAPAGAGCAPRSGATMSTRPGTLRRSRTQLSARSSPQNVPAETRTAVVARPASVKRLRAHPTGSHSHQEAACQGLGCAQHGSRWGPAMNISRRWPTSTVLRNTVRGLAVQTHTQ